MTPTLQAIALTLALAGSPAQPSPTAALAVQSQPNTASVFLDGRFVGTTPVVLKGVPYGRHARKLTRHGYRHRVKLVTVSAKVAKVNAELPPRAAGSLVVDSDPPEAEVFVNGRFAGRAPVSLQRLPAGPVHVRVEMEEFLPFKQEVAVADGKTTKIKATLQSKTEVYLLGQIKREPWRVRHYTELAHHYMTRRDYDRAFAMYAKGIDACAGPKAIPNDCLRHYNEMQYCYTGSVVNFADKMDKADLQKRIEQLYEEGIKRRPENERNYLTLIGIKRGKGEYADALALCEAAIPHARNKRVLHRLQRKAAEMLYRYGAWLSKQKRYADAEAQYEKAIAKYPKAYYTRSCWSSAISLNSGALKKPERALELRRQYIATYPKSTTARSYRKSIGDTLVSQGKVKEGLAEYRRYLKDYPDDPNCPTVLESIGSYAWSKLKNADQALAAYMEVVDRYPKCDTGASALQHAAQIYQAQGKKVLADALRALIVKRYPRSSVAGQYDDDPQRKKARAAAAALYSSASQLEKKDVAQAIATYEKLVKEYPNTYHAPLAQLRIASLHHARTKNYEAELAARARYVDLFPDRDDAPSQLMTLASRYTALGDQYAKQAGSDAAIKAKAKAYFYKAVQVYERLIKEFPKSNLVPAASYQIGLVYYQKTFEQQKAIKRLRYTAKHWPDSSYAPSAAYYEAWIHFLCLKNQRPRAIQLYHQYLINYPYESNADSIDYWLDGLMDKRPEPKGWWK